MASSLIKSLKGNELFKTLNAASDGTINDIKNYIDSGSYVFNLVLSGDMFKGYIGNKITALSGDSGTGKTFAALAAANALLASDKNAQVIYLDTEGATDKEQIEALVCDPSRFQHQLVNQIEDLSEMILCIAKTQKELPKKEQHQVLLVIDSLGNLTTSKEMNDLTEGNDKVDMTKAKKLAAMFRAATVPLTEAEICTIFTNHVYDTQEMYSQKIMKGGKALVYLASTIIEFSKRKDKDGTEVIGNIIGILAKKARKAKENAKVHTYISYKNGMNRYYGLLELAEMVSFVKRVGNRYEFPNGEKLFLKDILAKPESCWTQDVLESLNEKVKHKFNYGNSDDQSGMEAGIVESDTDEEDSE